MLRGDTERSNISDRPAYLSDIYTKNWQSTPHTRIRTRAFPCPYSKLQLTPSAEDFSARMDESACRDDLGEYP
jgi:hypothetical protein